MANLISFPHYTCGALLCDILNDKISPLGNRGNIQSFEHSLGKIGDTDTVQTEFDHEAFFKKLKTVDKSDLWVGTHAHPNLGISKKFDKIVLITTCTHRSQIYRWARVYHHYFKPAWQELSGMELIDKVRETAKNYLVPFEPVLQPNIVNLEFADVVDDTEEFQSLVQGHNYQTSMTRWKSVNSFLYQDNFWNSFEVKTFYQAEFEKNHKRYYVYNFK